MRRIPTVHTLIAQAADAAEVMPLLDEMAALVIDAQHHPTAIISGPIEHIRTVAQFLVNYADTTSDEARGFVNHLIAVLSSGPEEVIVNMQQQTMLALASITQATMVQMGSALTSTET